MDISSEVTRITEASFDKRVDDLSSDKAEAAEKFEALLATMLVKELRKGLGKGLFGEGAGSDIYGGWFDRHIGESLAQDGGLDLEGLIRVGIDSKIAAVEKAQEEQ